MGFFVTHLQLAGFRNYRQREFSLSRNLTILVGPNATGKTAVVEALQLLTAGRSFRKPTPGDLVRKGASEARLGLTAEDGPRLLGIELQVTKEGGKTYLLNGKPVRARSGITGVLPSVVFAPDDISMVKGPAEGRRAALDALGEQLSKTYGTLRREYERALRQRNALLKDAASSTRGDEWDETLADLGARLTSHRVRLLERVFRGAGGAYGTVSSGESLSMRYDMPWNPRQNEGTEKESVKEALLGELRRRAGEERDRGMTLSGPHRDDVLFAVDGDDSRSFASQGQQRSIVLAWKIAEVSVVEEVTGNTPLLLLDDVMSELDEARREMLAELVKGHAQTVITTANLQYFSPSLLETAELVTLS